MRDATQRSSSPPEAEQRSRPYDRLRHAWRESENRVMGSAKYFRLNSHGAALIRALEPVFERHVRGRTLDVGAGRLPCRFLVEQVGAEYTSVDITAHVDGLHVIGDAVGRLPFKDRSFATVICGSTLEHVVEPQAVVREIARVLEPGGTAIVWAPHMYFVHDPPHDYYRFTPYGLEALLRGANLQTHDVRGIGGLASTVLLFPTMACSLAGQLAGLPAAAEASNTVLTHAARFVDSLDRSAIFAAESLAVGVKPAHR